MTREERIELFQNGRQRLHVYRDKLGGNPRIVISMERQLDYLLSVAEDIAPSDWLADINIGLLVVREIEGGVDEETLDIFYSCSAEADAMLAASQNQPG